jgi:ABC-type nitrate/sulfonate/bicarbonate transport system substrate-binding protein
MRKTWILAVIAAVLAICLATPVFAGGGQEATGAGPELKKITIQFQPNPLFAAISVPLEKGWFQEEGIETVDIKNFSSGNLAGEALISGDLSVWVPGNMPVISMRHNGVPIVVTGNFNTCPAEKLMVRKDAGVKTPQDLYKIKIGLLQGSTASGVIEELATANGLDVTKLQIVNLPPPEQVTALKNNEIQALLCWPPASLQVEDVAVYMFDSIKYSHTRVPIVFGESFLRKNPKTAEAIMRVLYRGQEFCRDKANWPEAKAIHAKRSEQSLELVEQMWPYYWNLAMDDGSINQQFVDDFAAYTAFQVRNGMISNPVPVLDYTYTDILKKINPAYVKIEGKWKP